MDLNLGDTQLIISVAKKHGVLRNQLAYLLATAYWETARTMKPVKEAFWLSESWRKNNLRYYPWYGRGYVQLTWKRNYELASKKVGYDFIKNPEGVMIPEYSAEILVIGSMEGWFTTKKIPDYITLQKSDYINARRVINGTDKAKEIANIAKKYEKALIDIGYGLESTQKPTESIPDQTGVQVPETKKTSLWSLLIDLIISILKGGK